jgi:hypothetical protein
VKIRVSAVAFGVIMILVCSNWTMGQVPMTQIDLRNVGWQSAGAQPLLYRAIDFATDNSFWVLYPHETGPKLTPRDSEPIHGAALAHVGTDGKILVVCQVSLPTWEDAQLFVERSGEPIVQAGTKFQSFDSSCAPKASVSLTGENLMRTILSTDRDLLYVITNRNVVIAIKAGTLEILSRRPFPPGPRDGEISFAQNVAAFDIPKWAPGCWKDPIVRRTLSNSADHPWVQLDCSEFALFSDSLLLAKRRGTNNEVLSLINEDGSVRSSIATENRWFVDTPFFNHATFSSPDARRVAEYLFKESSFWDRSGPMNSIAVFDFSTRNAVLKLPIDDHPKVFSFALSPSGRFL